MREYKLGLRNNVRYGLRTGLIIGAGFSLWATGLRLLVGPTVFDRLGLSWGAIVALYFLAFSLGGSLYGALLPLKRRPAGAALLGFLLMCPMYLGAAILYHLTQNQGGSWAEDLILAVVLGVIAGVAIGIWLSMNESSDSRTVR